MTSWLSCIRIAGSLYRDFPKRGEAHESREALGYLMLSKGMFVELSFRSEGASAVVAKLRIDWEKDRRRRNDDVVDCEDDCEEMEVFSGRLNCV